MPGGVLELDVFATAVYDSDSSIHTKMCVCVCVVQVHVVYICKIYINIIICIGHIMYTTLSSVLDFGVDILQSMSFTNQSQQGS